MKVKIVGRRDFPLNRSTYFAEGHHSSDPRLLSTLINMQVRTASYEIDIATIRLSGRLDALEASDLRQLLKDHLVDGRANIAVDLSEVTFVDSAGLAALVKGMKDATLAGGDLRLVSPVMPDAKRVFELTRFDRVFTMAATLDDLLATW